MNIILDKKLIDEMDLSSISHYLDWTPLAQKYFLSDAGQEHYKLLAYLSHQINGEISDVGTFNGASALALSLNEQSFIYTYDIVRCIPEQEGLNTPLTRKNIKMYVASGQACIAKIAQSKMIVLDVDPHDGFQEDDILQKLIRRDYQGIVIVDDIHLNKEMKSLWDNVPQHLKKIDVTHLGHHSGTGIIIFNSQNIDVSL